MDFSTLYQGRNGIKDLTDEPDDLVARAQAGDDAAFSVIFKRHSRFVYKFIFAMLGEAAVAEESHAGNFSGGV